MPRYIVKLDGKYLEWSTVVDAPVTEGKTLEEFKADYQLRYGINSMKELGGRLARVEAKGTSSQIDDSIDELILGNRAGENETELSKDELIKQYCSPPPSID